MSLAASVVDPLDVFMNGAVVSGTSAPVPLVSTAFDIRIAAGLATVATTRIFRNQEPRSIEATITFPVPIHAVVYRLEARIGDRLLIAKAVAKARGREIYEVAIDQGRSSVLHEETLRGVHTLSIAHVPPGAEVGVTYSWVLPLTNLGNRGSLRVPLTVGDIYGRSPLAEVDDLVHGGPVHLATLSVACADGKASLHGRSLEDRKAIVPLNAPIDIVVENWRPRDLLAKSPEGKLITLRVEPDNDHSGTLDIAVLADRSGSMGSTCDRASSLTTHDVLKAALASSGRVLAPEDRLELWEFNERCAHVGSGLGEKSFVSSVGRLSPPSGGTEIGGAIRQVIASSEAGDVLILTDGKSHALDVQALARLGRRVSVILVGADSLEANIGHLAALTHGEIFVAAGNDIEAAVRSALAALRSPSSRSDDRPDHVDCRLAGMRLRASWVAAGDEDIVVVPEVAALATALLLPTLGGQGDAGEVAAAAGIVSHLTSLVLVDEFGDQQDELPALRKIRLPSPDVGADMLMERPALRRDRFSPPQAMSDVGSSPRGLGALAAACFEQVLSFRRQPLCERVDWSSAPHDLVAGRLDGQSASTAREIRELARRPELEAVAAELDIDPVQLAIAMLASQSSDRRAKRVLRAITDLTAAAIDHHLARLATA